MPLTGEDHGDPMLVAGGDDLIVLARTTRLDDGDDAGLRCSMDRVGEREECIGGEDAPLGSFARFDDRDFDAVDATHLASTNADQSRIAGEHDRIALHMAYHFPSEGDIVPKLIDDRDAGDGFPSQIRWGKGVGFLDQNPTADESVVESRLGRSEVSDGHQSDVVPPLGLGR